MVHFIVWKFIFIAVTAYNINGTPISVTRIIDNAQRRVSHRIVQLKVRLRIKVVRALARNTTPSFEAERKWASGLGDITPEGEFCPNEVFDLWLS